MNFQKTLLVDWNHERRPSGNSAVVSAHADAARGRSPSPAVGTYLYAFGDSAAESPTTPGPMWYGHGHELAFVFGAPLVDGTDPFQSSYSRRDKQLSIVVLRMWLNFIKTG